MLKSWSIQNFKPIVNSGELKLAPVTVLAGRNSSGKSSLLQSILMVKQTLSSKLIDRPLLPSGLDVRLGTFEDIVNKSTHSKTLSIGFKLDFIPEESPVARRRPSNLGARSNLNVKSVVITSKFDGGKENGSSHSAVEASKVLVDSVSLMMVGEIENLRWRLGEDTLIEDQKGETVNFSFRRIGPDECDNFLKNVMPEFHRLVPYVGGLENYLGHFNSQHKSEDYLIGLSHFLPTRLTGKFNIDQDRKSLLKDAVHNSLRGSQNYFLSSPQYVRLLAQRFRLPQPENFEFSTFLSESLKSEVQALCREKGITIQFSGQTLSELIEWFRTLKGIPSRKKVSIGDKLEEIIVNYLMQELSAGTKLSKDFEGLRSIYNLSNAALLEDSVEQITRFFTSSIRYLGPLRADPQASQEFAHSSELDDVGAKGEYAAAVYDANQNARIEWYNPVSQKIERATLKNALDTWVHYLDVANRIETKEAGLSGFGWRVVSKSYQTAFPLSAVGVGVSQVLPILVM